MNCVFNLAVTDEIGQNPIADLGLCKGHPIRVGSELPLVNRVLLAFPSP